MSKRTRTVRHVQPSESVERAAVLAAKLERACAVHRHIDPVIACLITAAVFVLYRVTLAPTLIAADAGELVTAAWELGVAHPPGYPLWCLLVHGWIAIFPAGLDVAHLVNAFSAVCGALTCGVVYLAARQLDVARGPALAAALLLGASRELWAQSVIAEVYTLNALVFVLCLYCLIRWDRALRHGQNGVAPQNAGPRDPIPNFRGWLVAFAASLGLGMTNHHTIGILGPVGLIWVLWRRWRTVLDWRLVAGCALACLLPLALYLYLPLRSATEPYMDWGQPRTLAALFEHVGRAQYKATYEPVERSAVILFFQAVTLLRYLLDQFSPLVGLVLLAVLPAVVWRRGGAWIILGVVTLGIWLTYGWLLNTKPERQEIVANQVFFIPVYVCMALLAAGAIDLGWERFKPLLARRWRSEPLRIAGAACMAMPVVLSFLHNRQANDFSDYWYAEDHAINLLATMEPNAVIFPSGDHNTFPLIYLHRVENVRPDITIADKYGYVEARDFPEVVEKLQDEGVELNGGKLPRDAVIQYLLAETPRPVYFTVKTALPPLPNADAVKQIQTGLLYRVAATPPQRGDQEIWNTYQYRNLEQGFDEPPDYGAVNVAADFHFFRGLALLREHRPDDAVAAMTRSTRLAWGVKEVLNNAGSALAESGMLPVANAFYREALRLDDGYVSALWNVARTASSTGRFEEAAAHFERLRRASPGDFRVPGELGYLYLNRLGNTRRAITYLQASLELEEDQPQIQQTLQELAAVQAPHLFPAVLQADPQHVNLGEVIQHETATVSFTLTNVSDKTIHLADVRSDCGCTVPRVEVDQLAAGATTTLTVTFRERERIGPQARKITIETKQGPPLVIPLKAHVLSPYDLTPSEITVTEAIPRSVHTVELAIRSRQGAAFGVL